VSARRASLPAFVLALAVGAASAQEEPPPSGATTPRGARDEAFKIVDAYVISNLQESLELTDEQFVKALPLVKRLQSERREYYLARSRALREMRRLLRSGAATEAQVLKLLSELDALETEGPARMRRDLEALDAELTPLQRAKYRVLEVDVEQRLREIMRRERLARPGSRRSSPPE